MQVEGIPPIEISRITVKRTGGGAPLGEEENVTILSGERSPSDNYRRTYATAINASRRDYNKSRGRRAEICAKTVHHNARRLPEIRYG